MSKEINIKQMSLLGDSHVNHSQLQEKEKEQMTIDTSGMKLLESLENVNLNGSLAKMLKVLLTSKTVWYSDRCKTIWKKKVSKSNVLLFQLQASVLGIKEKEFGLWATPNTMDTLPPRSEKAVIRQMTTARKGSTKPSNLREQVHPETMKMYGWMYPTPTQDSASERTKKYKQGGTPLPLAVKMYPTPSASCQMDVVAPPETVKQNSKGWSVTRVGTGTKFGAKLNDVVNKIYNTPTTNDAKNLTFPKSQTDRSSLIGNMIKEGMPKLGGKLNPTFVEFLMGYPMDWTKIEPTESKLLETQSFHKSQENLEKQSLKQKKMFRTPTSMDIGEDSFIYAAKILKGKVNRSSNSRVQITLSTDVAMEYLKNNPELIDQYDRPFMERPNLPNKLEFIEYLKSQTSIKKLSNNTDIPKTKIDHWFRKDNCFSYPSIEDWNIIKPFLKELKFNKELTYEIEKDWKE
jgi:hypothetical protein